MRAIETRWLGYRFRSRTEARWAIVFETLNVRWQYEAEGFDLTEGALYLPDFYLPAIDCFVEVKGEKVTREDRKKIEWLAIHSGKRVFIAGDIPPPSPASLDWPFAGMTCVFRDVVNGIDVAGLDFGYFLCRCETCGIWGIEYQGRSERIRCACDLPGDRGQNADRPEILHAYATARSARWEHGERPTMDPPEHPNGLAMLREQIKRLGEKSA